MPPYRSTFSHGWVGRGEAHVLGCGFWVLSVCLEQLGLFLLFLFWYFGCFCCFVLVFGLLACLLVCFLFCFYCKQVYILTTLNSLNNSNNKLTLFVPCELTRYRYLQWLTTMSKMYISLLRHGQVIAYSIYKGKEYKGNILKKKKKKPSKRR